MTEDPKIKLGDREFSIPKLAIKQNRHVEPLAARNIDFFSDPRGMRDLTPERAEDFIKIVYHALTRALPTLAWEQFEAMEVSMRDIIAALPVCISQSGLFRPATEGAPPTGEATSPSTGTES